MIEVTVSMDALIYRFTENEAHILNQKINNDGYNAVIFFVPKSKKAKKMFSERFTMHYYKEAE